MTTTVCAERIKQVYHIPTYSSSHGSATSWNCLKPTPSALNHRLRPLDVSVLPKNPPSLKGISRFEHYEAVCKILQAIKRSSNPSIQFEDPISRLRAMQEAMEILFFENVIEDLLLESGFYSHFIQLHGHELIVNIMTYDFQKYKFLFRPPKTLEGISDTMLMVAEALWSHKVKLSATWARMRVNANAQSPIQLLPSKKLEQFYMLITSPVYARVNCTPASTAWSNFVSKLEELDLHLISSPSQLIEGRPSAVFLTDGLIALSPECRPMIHNTEMRKGPLRSLFPQDRGSHNCISRLTPWFKSVQEKRKDVIITNCDQGSIAGHISSLVGNEGSQIFMFGVPPVAMKQLEDTFSAVAANNVHLIPAQFKYVDPSDDLLANVGVIFCNPPSSLTAVQNPIDFIMQEGDDYIAQVLNTHPMNTTTLEREQSDILTCALRLKQADHIAYFTRSCLDRENDDLIGTVLKTHIDEVEKMDDIKWAGFELDQSLVYKPKDAGGYMSTFKLAPPKPLPAASDVIAEAIKKGILNPNGIDGMEYIPRTNSSTKLKKKSSKKRIFSQHEGIPMTFSAKQKVIQKKKEVIDFNKKPRPFL